MWDDMTYENIMADMLSRAPNDIDKRQGSIIYDAIAPCAFKLAETYFFLNNFIDLVSGDTAVGEFLDRVVTDYGIARKQATKAIRQIETSGEIAIGTRWGIENATYIVTDLISISKYKAECEQFGVVGNQYTGQLENIDNVNGITATLTDILISGEDIETDDNLRLRFYNQIQAPSTSGNADNYVKWALEVPGVGDAKVFPLWNGNGTVKILVIDENMTIDANLPPIVLDYIETVRPIGVTVTVSGPDEQIISVSASVVLDGTITLEEVKTAFSSAYSEYFKEIVFETYSVSYARIGSLLLATEGVTDYTDLLVNGGTANITLLETEMPIAGTVTLSEVV